MDLTPYINDLAENLAGVAATGDDETRRTAALLVAALEPAARLALMNALSDLAAEITDELDGTVVDVRLDGRDVIVAVSDVTAAEELPPPPSPAPRAAGETSRITLRLPEELKNQAEQAAARQGISLNTWLSRSVRDALQAGNRRHRGLARGRISGWVTG